ncbi:ABC transporter ATP-binding protein [Microbacterium sp. AK031]|uniref:ABC transporter ATP-binding protein n=1 Tax=Microbacterium sp. AK031 TaxID=2723076 RepID=UPI0021693E1F|nr:ABC transporter ATP-binding protein [Microbacterium sp. AK031]MCS3843370.1 oligopeptide/dipeptide ABC transporter ATP-binding protein [Microbacterium sp. AK031]
MNRLKSDPGPSAVAEAQQTGEAARPPLLEVRDLTVSFDTEHGLVKAVNGMNFTVSERERVGIVGESGSGKSVTAQALLGLLQGADITGEILFEGRNILTMPKAELRALRGWDISYVFQDPLSALDPVRTIGDQVSQPLRLRGVPRNEARERAIEMLAKVGIREPQRRYRDYPHQFSGGMRQRVMIAIALIGEPRLVIADEPTTALDVRVQAQVIDLLYTLTEEQGAAVVFITHDLGILAGFADRMMVMYAGRVMEKAPTEELYHRSINPYTLGLLESLPRIDGPIPLTLTTIGGRPPSPSNLPSGCPFSARCRYVQDICREEAPALLTPPNGTHPSACHFSEWLAEEPGVLR